ncbi:MAG: LysR family transcriptional regulator [Pseudomonadota bacterium]
MDKFSAMRTFAQVAMTGGFSSAAKNLGVSKATVSKQIAELESYLGAQLLIRTTRRVRLTEDGIYYADKCREILETIDATESVFQTEDLEPEGDLRIAAPQTFSELHLATALDAFLHKFPKINVELILQDSFVGFIEQEIDVGIRISNLEDSSLIARRFASTRIVTTASPEYLRSRGTPTKPGDLRDHELILDANFRDPRRWRFSDNGKEIAIPVAGRIKVNSAVLAREMALRHAGLIMGPAFVVREAVAKQKLKVVLEKFETSPLGIYVLYPQQRHVSKRIRALVSFLAEHFSDEIL